jgi:hypothetical protein
MEPNPVLIAKTIGATPPEDVNVCVRLKFVAAVSGAIVRAGLIVTEASENCPSESVTRTLTAPLEAGAVNSPEEPFIVPLPEMIENV